MILFKKNLIRFPKMDFLFYYYFNILTFVLLDLNFLLLFFVFLEFCNRI